ncbi:sensor histidine kinase [Myroides sp. LJL119]
MDVVKSVFLFWLFFNSILVSAQNRVLSKKYDVSTGLISNDIQALCIDSKGILWLGSSAGVSKVVQGVVQEDRQISDYNFTNVTEIIEDPYKGIWISSYGQGVLYKKGDSLQSFATAEKLISDRVRALSVLDKYIYVGTLKGVSLISISDLSVINPSFNNQQTNNTFEVTSFFQINNKVYATTVSDGVYVIEPDQITKVNHIQGIFSSFVQDNLVFYGTKDGLVVEDFCTKEILAKQHIPNIRDFELVNGELFIISSGFFDNQGGVYKWDKDKAVLINPSVDLQPKAFLSMTYDQNHEFLYIGTGNAGLYQIDLFSALSVDTSKKQVMALQANGPDLYVFSNNGLEILKDSKSLKQIGLDEFKKFQQKNYQFFKDIAVAENYFFEIDYQTPYQRIVFFKAMIHNNRLWVSSNIGLFELSLKGEILKYYNIYARDFDFFGHEFIQVTQNQGVRIFSDLANFRFRNFSPMQSIDIPREVVGMQRIGQYVFFASALDGLYYYSSDQGFVSMLEKGWFKQKRIKKLTKGPKGILYVATDTNDIYALQTDSPIFTDEKIIEKKQILGSDISFISWDVDKIIVGTNKGLTVFKYNSLFYFDGEQGFHSSLVNTTIQQGRILHLGTQDGLYSLNTYYFQNKERYLQVELLDVVVNGNKVSLQALKEDSQMALNLPYYLNSLQIYFDVQGAKFPNKLQFEYRLKPDGNWRLVEDYKVVLHYLEAGIYPIELKITDFDSGTQVLKPLLYVKIDKPFYQTAWFVLFGFLGIVVLGYLIYNSQINRLKRESSIRARKLVYDKRLAEVKLLAVRSQMNSHFIFNVLSSIQYYILKGSQDQAFNYLGKFAHLIRESLNLSTKERVSLACELDYLRAYVEIENMRLDGRVNFEISCEPELDLDSILLPPMLLQPFVENAMIHAFPNSIENPHLLLKVKKINDKDIKIIILDNGIGSKSISKKKGPYKSKGMSIVRERMSLIQEYLDDDLKTYANLKGSRIELILKNVIK